MEKQFLQKSDRIDKCLRWLFAFFIPFVLVGGWSFFIHAIRCPANLEGNIAQSNYSIECWQNLFVFGGLAGLLGILVYKLIHMKLSLVKTSFSPLLSFILPFVIFGFIHGWNSSEGLHKYSGNPSSVEERTVFWTDFFETGFLFGLIGLGIERTITYIVKFRHQ